MSDSWDMRLSNAEREEAMNVLGEHVSSGRLDIDEFGSRSAKVSAAARISDLIPLFEDLPAPKPAVLAAASPSPSPREPVHRTSSAPARLLRANAIPIAAVLAIAVLIESHSVILAAVVAAVVALFLGRRWH